MRKGLLLVFILMFFINTVAVGFIKNGYAISSEYTVEGVAVPIHSGIFHYGLNISTVDMCLAPDGSVYTLFRYTNNTGDTPRSQIQIVKWNSNAEVQWTTNWHTNGSVIAWDIAADANGIYVTGRYYYNGSNLLLVSFSHSGKERWVQYWSLGFQNEGTSIGIASDGSIYVGAVVLRGEIPQPDSSSFVLKYTADGSFSWYRAMVVNASYPSWMDVLVSHDDRIFASTIYSSAIVELTKDGNIIDEILIEDAIFTYRIQITPSGDFVSTFSFGLYRISWINSTGYTEWYYDAPRIWTSMIGSISEIGGFDAAPDNSIYVLCGLALNGTNSLVLTKFNSIGSMVWNRSLVYEHDIFDYCIGGIEVTNDGTIFIASTFIGITSTGTALSVYKVGEFTPYWQTVPDYTLLMIIIVGAIGVILILLILAQKEIRI